MAQISHHRRLSRHAYRFDACGILDLFPFARLEIAWHTCIIRNKHCIFVQYVNQLTKMYYFIIYIELKMKLKYRGRIQK